MKIRFWGDFHLGRAISHSTEQGAKKFNNMRKSIIDNNGYSCGYKDPYNIDVNLGDVFDSFRCSNNTLTDAVDLTSHFNIVNFGNHDFARDLSKTSALEDLKYISDFDLVKDNEYDYAFDMHKVALTIVPYQSSQTKFEELLLNLVPPNSPNAIKILGLHTNIESPYCSADIDNNLTKEMIESLLEKFDYIITSHEHNSRVLYDGRVIVTGSIIPMDFGQMTDKWLWVFDTESLEWSKELLWSVCDNFKRVLVQEFLDMQTPMNFIEVTGEIQPSDVLPVNKKITNWFRSGEVIAIRNNTQLIKSSKTIEKVSGLSWKDMVKSKLNEQQLKAFEELDHE